MPVPNNDPIDTTACLQIFKLFTKTTQDILSITWERLHKVQNELIITEYNTNLCSYFTDSARSDDVKVCLVSAVG